MEELLIMERRKTMRDNDIKVSVCCMAYNHEKFIKRALDSFVSQKTNFKFEIIINDDASTDNTTNIIKEYEKKYPDIIKPIYQKENQYSKGVDILKILIKLSKGKYIALCECDDYWCDDLKLQKQYDCMEKNIDCSMCVHNTINHDLLKKKKDCLFNDWEDIHELTEREVFFDWNVHTSSYFIRKKYTDCPDYFEKYWFGDYRILTFAYYYGKIISLPDVMSIYNYNNIKGVMYNVDIEKIKIRKEYLKQYNDFSKNRYKKIIDERIREIDFIVLLLEFQSGRYSKKELNEKRKELLSHQYFKMYIKKLSVFGKIKFFVKIYFSRFYKMIKGR